MMALARFARALTLFRFVAAVPFAALLVGASGGERLRAAILPALFAAVALSDWSDGRVARRANAASPSWGRLDAAADITFNASALATAALVGWIAPWPALAVLALGVPFLLRGSSSPRPGSGVPREDAPGKLAGVLFYALVGIVTAEVAWPGSLGPAVVRRAGDAVALYAVGVVAVRFAMSSWRRWTKRSA